MAHSENIFALDAIVKIYVPGTVDIDKPAPELQAIHTRKTVEFMAGLFGGATYGRFVGAWMDGGEMIEEPQNIVYSYTTKETAAANLDAVIAYARQLCKEMKQYSITLEYRGRLGFVEPEK